MLTFTRAGRTSLFIEDPADSTGFGRLGFLLPDGTPHLPTQLTIEDAWYWKNDTLGAGWFIFLADGMSFPNPAGESRLLDLFLMSLKARLPRTGSPQDSGFVWVVGDPRSPLTISVVRLDVTGTTSRRTNAKTSRSTQTFTFQQFQVTVNQQTEIRLLPDFAGFELVSTLSRPSIHVRIPVAPYVYRLATSLIVPFGSRGRGALQFTLESLQASRFGYGALDIAVFYYLRATTPNGQGPVRVLRYPLLDGSLAQGTFDFQASLYPADPTESYFNFKGQSDGTSKSFPSFFRTTAGYPVHLRQTENSRFYMRSRPTQDRQISASGFVYYLAPSGEFEIEAEGPLDPDTSMTRILAGFSGTEYIAMKSLNGHGPGDLISFDIDRNAFAETFGRPQVGGGVLLSPDYLTSWMKIIGADGGERFFYAQPTDAPLFQAGGIFGGTPYLDFSEMRSASLTNPTSTSFPMAPVAGINWTDSGVDIDIHKAFERDLLVPYRDQIIKRNSATLQASPERSMRRMLQLGAGTEKRTTPQGLLVDVDVAANRYTKVLLGKLDGAELAISSPTADFQQALSTNKLFLVISHLANVGDFTDNTVSMSSWNFVADIAATAADAVKGTMLLKFSDGVSLNDLVNDTSQWTEPDKFTDENAVSAKLKAIIAEMRTKAAGAGSSDDNSAVDNDADIARYYRNFIDTVIDDPNWAGIVIFDVSLGNPNELPREIRGLLPGMVVTKGSTSVGGTSYIVPTNAIDPAFKAHHLRIDIAKVNQAADNSLDDIDNSSMSALVDYTNANQAVTGLAKWTDDSKTTIDIDAVANLADFSFRVKFMRITFENSFLKIFLSDVTLRFHKLFKEVPAIIDLPDGTRSVNSIDVSGSLQQINGIPTYVFRYGCIDPLKNNFIVCADKGLDGLRAFVQFPETSPVITSIESTRVDYNMLQLGVNVGDSNIAEFVIAGYMATRELDGRDFFSYDRVGFGKLAMALNYNTLAESAMTDQIAKPEEMGNPFWIFTPNTMQFDTVRGETRDGSIVNRAPITIKGIAESVSTFSAADAGVFPIPNLVPMSGPLIPYQPASASKAADPSPVTYVISYGISTAGIGLNVSAGGLFDITVHTAWKEGTWNDSGEDVFYTALQWGTPITGLDIGKQGMFKAQLKDFGFGEVPTSSNDRIFFIYVNSLALTLLKWQAKVSLMLFAPAPADKGFAGAFGDGGANINSWFGSFSLTKGSSGTSSIATLPQPTVVEVTTGDPEIELSNAAIEVKITPDVNKPPTHAQLRVHGYIQNVKGVPQNTLTITVTARLYKDGGILPSGPSGSASVDVQIPASSLTGSFTYDIMFPQQTWPSADVSYTADVRISGEFISSKRSKRVRQTNTVNLRKDHGKPSNGSPIVNIDYVALGRGIRMRRGSAPGGGSNLNVHPAPRTVGDALALMQQMLPDGQSGPDLYNVLRDIYAPSAGMMVGVDITIMGWLRLAVVVDEADEIYGGLVEIKKTSNIPAFASKIVGLRIEILYRRISDTSDLGVYEGTLVLPDYLRYWDVGGFSITIPVISLQIYTDGGFLLDLGFPTGTFASGYDFSRSFAIQGMIGPFPVMGAVGIYLGRLSAAAVPIVPKVNEGFGIWKSAWKFGLAAKLGLGKSYKRGPLSFELSLTAQLVFQGVAAALDRVGDTEDDNEAVPAPADFLMLEASLAIVLLAQGKFEVKVKGFGLSASLMVKASLGVQFRYMTATPIRIQLSITLEAELKVSLDLVLFSISISFKFVFKFQPTFTIPNNERPDWLAFAPGYPPTSVDRGDNVLTGQSASSARALARRGLLQTTVVWSSPGALWNSSFDSAFQYTDGDGDHDLRDSGKLPIDLVFVAPFTVNKTGALVGVSGFVIPEMHARFLHAGILVWATKMVLGNDVDGNTTLDADELDLIRATINDEREEIEYSTLRSFLDDNYAFNVLSAHTSEAEDALKPDGASETAAVVFPMVPTWSIEYDGTTIEFDEQTIRNGDYFQNLDDYLAALLLRAEKPLGDDLLGPPDTTQATTRPLAEHVFTSYFELMVDAGIEDAIEAKVPRAEDPSGITTTWTLATLVSDVIDRTNPLDIRPVSGVASRLMLGGHQLPDTFTGSEPPMPSGFQPLYQLTGQQVPVDLSNLPDDVEDDDVVWELSLKDGDTELATATATFGMSGRLASLATDLSAAIGFGNAEPRIERLAPYLERNLDYPVDERVPVDASGSGTLDQTLMPFSSPLLTRLRDLDAGARIASAVTNVEYAPDFSDQIVDTSTVPTSDYKWALVVPFTAGKVVDALASTGDASTTTYLTDTYTLGGTDELTRGRIAAVMSDLINGNPGIENVDVLHLTDVSGVAGQKRLVNIGSRIVKTNLSTISAPRSLLAMTPPEEKYYGELDKDDIFASLRLLWEASVVNAPGFFLEYDGDDGLPDAAFGATDTADLSLVIRFSDSNSVPAYANALWYNALPTDDEHFYIESLDAATKTAVPVGVPGSIAFYAGRDVVAGSASDAVRSAASLFNLVAYRIKDAGSHAGNWSVSNESWSLPYGPLKLDETQLPTAILNAEWKYEIIVPWTQFLTGGRTQSPLFATTGALSPYDLVGGDIQFELAALDTFGNQFSRTASVEFDVLYTDPLMSIPQWPEVKSAYHINADGQVVLILEFGSERFTGSSDDVINRARALRMQFETIWFQLKDANTSVSLHTTLISGNGELSITGPDTFNEALRKWVEEILTFLNAKVGGGSPSPLEMKVITTAAIDRATRDAQTENIHQLKVSVAMSRPASMVDAAAVDRLQSIQSIVSDLKADTDLIPDLLEFGEDEDGQPLTGLAADSMVGFAQRFETAFPELRVATGDAEAGDQTLWAVRMGRGVGESGPGIRVNVHPSQHSFFGNAPLSTRLESCVITDPEDGSKTVQFDNVDMDKLGRRFVAVIDDMLSESKVVKLRKANATDYAKVMSAKETLAGGVPNGMLSIYDGDNDNGDGRKAASRELFRQALLKSLSAAYDVDTVIGYDVTVTNSETVSGTPPNLFGRIVSLDPEEGNEQPFVVGTAKIRLGNDGDGNAPKLAFAFSTERDGERAQIPAHLGYQVTYVEHEIRTDKPAWAPPSGSYEYRDSTWLKLILPDNPRILNDSRLPNDPIQLSPSGPTNVPIPLREIPTAPAVLRQLATPEVAAGDVVTLDKAAAWEYEYQIERPRAAQDRIYLHLAFNKKMGAASLLAADETLLHALCRFDLMYSRLIGADLPVEQQTQPEPSQLIDLLPYIEDVAAKWGSWEPSVPVHEYTWVEDDWAYYMSETISEPNSDTPNIGIRLKPLPIVAPVAGQNFGNFPEIRVPNPLTNGPQDLFHQPSGAAPGDVVTYSFEWAGVVPDNQTRSFVFSNLNVLKTENARGRMWLTRNENLGELDGYTTNERFIYRSGASEFTEPVQPFIDRTVPVNIVASVPAPGTQSIAGYLEQLFNEVFSIAIDNGYPWPLIKIGARYGYDPRKLLSPPKGPDPDDQFIVYLPVLEHVPFTPGSTSGLASEIQATIATWEQHHDIPNSPTRATGFYEFDLSVFSTLNRTDKSSPMLRLRRLWIKRFG